MRFEIKTDVKKFLKILVVCIFILLAAVQAGKSFVLDEIDFPIVAHATSQTLKPIYYRGEALPQHVGTYHPTLYINSLAAFIRLFGFSETSVRFFGVICTLLTAWLLVLIFRQLTNRKNEFAEVIFLGLFLLNPYTLANTTLPDIDSTILPVVLLLFVYFALRFVLQQKNFSTTAVVVLGGLFGLALWSKLTTPLILPLFLLGLAIIVSKNYKASLLFALKVTLIGGLGFVITYFIYCKALGLSTTYTYHFLIDSFTKGTSSDGPLVGAIKNLKNIRTFVFWPTLPVAGLMGISFIGVMLDNDKSEKTRIKKLLLALAALVTIFYIALIAPFGGFFKYPFPVFGILMLGIVLFYDRYYRAFRINYWYAGIALLIGFILEKIAWKDAMFSNGRPFSGIVAFLLIVIASYIVLRLNPRRLAPVLLVLFIFFSIGFQLSISRIQAISPYPTKYHYGQTGLDQATAYLRSNTKPDEIIWSMKDVGYYVNNKYYESYAYYFDKSLESDLIAKLKGGKVRYYVATTGIGQDNIDYYANIKNILDTYAVRDKQFGNFVIYKSKV